MKTQKKTALYVAARILCAFLWGSLRWHYPDQVFNGSTTSALPSQPGRSKLPQISLNF
ncbi:uncharacterized protein METZ01_LOCUS62699 [marine metagenome]|uniref:Uncharacterized protein n=1 Tax=marine metagenome TaxID=408172 RepID=A0A381T0T7_9ZZZZ